MMKYKQKLHTSEKGFTMIEMMVAVSIFTLALAALMSIASSGLKSSRESERQVAAEYLAIEAIEATRNIRDETLLLLNDTAFWIDIFDQDGCLSSGGDCSVVFDGDEITLEPCNSCTVFYNDNVRAFKQFESDNPDGGYTDSGFTRRVQIEQISSNIDEVIMKVFVEWETGSVSASQDLYLWL